MILFDKDWENYPSAIVHNTTTNESFLRVANILKRIGKKNHSFLLALHNPELEFIDYRSPDLTEREVTMILVECTENPWFLLREILKAPPSSGFDPEPYRASVANIMFLWAFFNYVIPYLVQPRQTGKSFNIFGLITMLITVLTANTKIALLTKDNILRSESMATFKRLLDNLPWYLQFRDNKDADNSERISINARGNSLRILVARASEEDADGVGRGLTVPILGIDEIAYFKNIHATLPAAINATGAARDIARRNGSIYGIFFATTAGKLNTKSGKYAFSVYKDGTPFSYDYLDCVDKDELYEKMRTNAGTGRGRLALMFSMEFNHLQLEYSDEWLKEKVALTRSSKSDIETDQLNIWTNALTNGLLTDAQHDKVISSMMAENMPTLEHGNFMLTWYIEEKERLKYFNKSMVVGIDTSDAAGDDEIGIVFLDVVDGSVIATGKYNVVNLIEFGRYLIALMDMYSKAVFVIERQSSAIAIIDQILETFFNRPDITIEYILTRIFSRIVDEAPEGSKFEDFNVNTREAYLTGGASFKKNFGFKTAGSGRYARSNLYGTVLQNSIRLSGDKVRDKNIINQMLNLVIKNNRLDHKAGEHDDILFAYLLAHWFLQHAANKSFYGIDMNRLLTRVDIENSNKIERIIEELDIITEKIQSTNNPLYRQMHIARYEKLEKELPDDNNYQRQFSVDKLATVVKSTLLDDTIGKTHKESNKLFKPKSVIKDYYSRNNQTKTGSLLRQML